MELHFSMYNNLLLQVFIFCLNVFHRVSSVPQNWEKLSSSLNIAQIDAGISKYVWAIDYGGKPHVKVGLKGQWTEVSDFQDTELSWVSSGAAGVWGINKKLGVPVFREGITASRPLGTGWSKTEGRGFAIIESGISGSVYALTRNGKLYYRAGIIDSDKKGASWRQIWGTYRFMSAGSYGIWTVDYYGRIYFGVGSSEHLSRIKNWRQVDQLPNNNEPQSVITGFDGSVWALGKNGDVFQRESVNILKPTGDVGWKQISGLRLRQITAGLPGVIGVTDKQDILVHKDRKCGGLLVESSGIFSTPNYPNLYPNDVVCLWVIKVPEATQITVTFQDFDIGNSDGDFVAYSPDGVYPSNKAPSVIKDPGKKLFTFSGNTAFFEFVSDSKTGAKGFFASYNTDSNQATTQRPTTKPTTPFSVCGGSLYEESGSLTSQSYPQNYPSSSDCTWFITVAPSKKIQLSFTDVDIEGNAACGFDFVEFGDGARKGENAKKKLCENNKFEFTSSGNQIWIRFFSDSSVEKRGFKASWKTVTMTQPDVTTKEMKTTMKPTTRKPTTMSKTTKVPLPRGWQYASPISQRFMMVDTGMTDKIVALDKDFRPYIHMNNNWARLSDERYTDITTGDSGTWAIRPDFRAVFHSGDGSSLQSNRWTLVGNDEFKQIDSGPYNSVFAVRRDGIVAYRDGITKQTPSGTRWVNPGKKLKSISVGSYGIWGTDDFDTIHFARRPSDVSRNPISWRALPGLRLKTIEAGFGNEVWGVANDGRVYRRAGVSHDTPFGTNWNNEDLTLEDVTTGLKGVFGVNKDGRIITRTDLSQKCGGIFTSQSGRILSPGYPLTTYPTNKHCLWVIRVPNANKIRLNINFFDIHKTAFCTDDYLLLYKRGSYSPENVADKYCGREIDIAPSFIYNGNEVWIQFNSGARPSSLAPRGFDIRYSSEEEVTTVKPTTMTGCGGTFTENYGSISSPAFPKLYQGNLRCLYNIMIDPRRELILKFDDFAIENDSQCRFDFLLIKTSENNGRELGKFCGSSTPPDIQVGQNKVMILFKSDASVNKRGFRMVWSSQPKKGVVIPPTTKAPATTKRPMPHDRTTTEMKKIEPVTSPQIPSDWTQIRSDIKIAHIDDGISPNAWATDEQGNTYILEGKNWRLVGNYQMKYITSGGSGVWGIDKLGSTFYRRGVAPLAPKGAYWASVPGPKLEKIDSGPKGSVMALDENGNILLREGITNNNAIGSGWRQVGSGYKHLSVGSYGYWVIDQSNQAYFAQATKIGPFSRGLRWTPIGRNFIQVKAGFGGSLWAVEPDGQLYERQGVTAITPTGISWKKIGNLKVNGVSTGMAGVFASVKGTNDVIMRPDRVCGDILKRPNGNFSSPRHPLDYPSGSVCLWQIQVPGASKISVQFDTFQLERAGGVGSSYCNKDYLLYLRDGKFPSTFGVKKRCGRDGSPLIFEGDKAWIEFASDDSNNFPGFNARYEAVLDPGQITDRPIVTQRPTVTKKVTTIPPDLYQACGGEIDAASVESGVFAHPGYPGDYKRDSRCEYVIRTRPNSRIRLDFERFDLEGASDCRYDFIEIRDGERGTSELIGKYCGKRNLTNIVSKSNVLFVKFESDGTTHFKGFLAKWRRVSPFATTKKPTTTTKSGLEGPSVGQIFSRCGGTIDASKTNVGFFTHAGYPGQYKNKEDCTYIIKTLPGRKLKLSFDKFALEAHEKCQFDYLEVRDGSTLQAPKLGKFCGSAKPRDVMSNGNSMLIKFVSDYASKGSGFLAKWNVEFDNTLPTFKPNTKTAKKDAKIITDCGGILDGPSGLFATPNYPNDYGPSLDCEWSINAGNSKVIQLTFEYFDLEKSKSGCVSDYVQIFDGPTRLDRNLGKYCNKMPNELISSGSKMRVLFHSDEGSNYRGFVARWAAQDAPIKTTPAVRTTKNPCFQGISGLAGEITKGGISSFYEPNTDCVWIITVQRGSKIRMQFDFFDIETSPFCSNDFLKVLDGPSDISRTLINECGRKNLQDVISSGNEVFIRFKTDARNNGRGFIMRWSAIRHGQATMKPTTAKAVNPSSNFPQQVNICDQTKKDLFADSGTIVTPNYPRNFPSNQRCSMIIRTSPGKRIIVSFDDFSMEVSPECRRDALVIRDGSPFAKVLSNACGSSLPSDVTSSSNALHLDFKSDDLFEQKGFRLKWTAIPIVAPPVIPTQGPVLPPTQEPVLPPVFPEAPQCGGRLYGSTGSLNNPTFNRQYPFAMTCTWILEVGPSSKIDLQLNFARFSTEDCSSFLMIRNGMRADSRVMKKFCKNEAPYNLRSQGNMVYIEQHIKENEEPRFSITWRERTDQPYSAFTCGGARTQSNGVITSPNFPSAYPNNAFCTWMIVAPKNHKISMDVTRFDLQDVAGCSKDYLSFRNGQTSESPLFGRYCGRNIPRRIESTGNKMWIQMKTDCEGIAGGFRMTYRFVKDGAAEVIPEVPTQTPFVTTRKIGQVVDSKMSSQPPIPPVQPTAEVTNINAQGGFITGSGGILQSPSYPRNYPNNQEIIWVLKGPAAGRIAISFKAFNLEQDSACRYDYVELRDGQSGDSPAIGKFCGNHLPATYTSADNSLWVKFASDASENHNGFQAEWQWLPAGNELPASRTERRQSKPACGGLFTGSKGEISTPNYPAKYDSNSDCIWVIRPRTFSPIELRFTGFSVEPESRCGYDYVEIRDGDSSRAPSLGRFCGSTIPDVVFSNGGAFWIKFKSDSSSNYRGFAASWKTVERNRRRRSRRNIDNETKKSPGCNYSFKATNGTLSTDIKLNSHGKLTPSSCKWIIKSPNKGKISLHIKDLGFKKHHSCIQNYMDIYIHRKGDFELLTRLCPFDKSLWHNGLDIPTGSRQIAIKYIVNKGSLSRPLRVTWTTSTPKDQSPTAFPLFGTNTGCGGRLTNPTGAIATPGYPQKYPRNTACVWTINVPDSKSIIEVKFDSFMLENHPNCRYDYLLIRDGDSQSSPIIGKFCGDTIPNLIRSRSNRLWMRFYSDSAFTGNGFLASYAATKKPPRSLEGETIPLTTKSGNCGGTLSDDSGTIKSPKYPENYPNGMRCVWMIENDNPQSTINLSFEDFKLEETQQCMFDYLLIEEISSGNKRMIGKFCGRTVPASSTSISGQKLRISFVADESSNDKGFKLNWQRVGRSINFGGSERAECGGSKTGLLGFLRSNNYPENYADNENCEWKLSAPEESMKIQLRFADFELELSADCEYDYIEVYDGETRNAPRLGKFCGRQVPDLIESTQKNMLVIFKTDKSDTRSGFEATWVSVFKHDDPRSVGVSRQARIPDASQGSCGGSFTTSTGSISTPKYPNAYPPDSLCTWKISADPKHQIKLQFTDFNLEKHSNCKYDSVTIRDGAESNSKVLGQSCGSKIPKEIISSGHALWIQFVSDNSKQLIGFKAEWEFIRKSGQIACGTRFRLETGELSSPNYPRAPSDRGYCTWVIEVPYSMKIELTFKDINLRSSASCTYGYVQVFDGDTIQSPELGRFCKTFLPRPILSSGNRLLIGFQPDGLAISRGFKAEWKAIKEEKAAAQPRPLPATPCGTTLTSESGNIILPKGVKTCLWLIKPASGKQITLSIPKANLIPNPNCDVEKLEVRNGFTFLAPLLLKICGSLQPRSVTSFTGVLRLEYKLFGNADKQDVHLFWTTKKERLQSTPLDKGSCGIIKVPFPEQFVNNRAIVASGMLPWMAALLSGSGTIYCGASILSPKWIITAAHCFRRYPFYAFRKIVVGELNLFKSDGTEQVLDIKLIHIHPGYNAITNENDIALVQLDTQITLNEKVNTICLPDKDTDIKPGTICTTAGWGTRRFLGKPSKPLVLARIPIVPTNVCNSTNSYAGNVKEKMICAGRSTGGLDTCQGDGGGPLTCEVSQGKNVLVGISSWGSGCAYPNRYGVYTEVQKHLQWISSIFDS